MSYSSYLIHIDGLVQGVGFRPFVYRLAKEENLTGWVENTNENISILVSGEENNLNLFISRLKSEHPRAATISHVQQKIVSAEAHETFTILPSKNISSRITQVSPDIAVCEDCLEDMSQQPHRQDYPLINCTHCGPRFTIIKNLPYDRAQTTMDEFKMCPACKKEYENPFNRRFHAQPTACNTCGPSYSFINHSGKTNDIKQILKNSADIIHNGGIIALKGIGGYNLIADAFHPGAVQKLRSIKKRDQKPFALMGRSVSYISPFVEISKNEKQLLESWRRPIVLLKEKTKINKAINPGLNQLGIVLPYMPFHYQLFEQLCADMLILTSGNISDEPITISDEHAIEHFGEQTDAIVYYNRTIHNRADDSVAFIAANKPRLIRRSRGYVPAPIETLYNCEGILATGAELTNTFCIGKDHKAIISQHIGDLKNPDTLSFYEESIERFSHLFRHKTSIAACDLHPDYLSTRFAESLNIPLIKIQHHHAHIASVMAEHQLTSPVIGISLDGTGLGDDGKIWGGEYLICDAQKYERFNHLEYRPLPGGDKAIAEPWRNALGLLIAYYDEEWEQINIPFVSFVRKQKNINILTDAIRKKINTPYTSSAGRLFDAIAALLMTCPVARHHAEAPMLMEAKINTGIKEKYELEASHPVRLKPLIDQILEDIKQEKDESIIITKFHNTIIYLNFVVANKIRKETGINDVAMSGGVFQNRYILEKSIELLEEKQFRVFSNEKVPANDAGISLGQMAIAANKTMNQTNNL